MDQGSEEITLSSMMPTIKNVYLIEYHFNVSQVKVKVYLNQSVNLCIKSQRVGIIAMPTAREVIVLFE